MHTLQIPIAWSKSTAYRHDYAEIWYTDRKNAESKTQQFILWVVSWTSVPTSDLSLFDKVEKANFNK